MNKVNIACQWLKINRNRKKLGAYKDEDKGKELVKYDKKPRNKLANDIEMKQWFITNDTEKGY